MYRTKRRQYSEKEIKQVFYDALSMFQYCLDTDVSEKNTLLEFFTPATGINVYERMCSKYFPAHLRERYKEAGYFESFMAQAFVGETMYGIMVRSDLTYAPDELLVMLLHEISHLHCTRYEIEGGNFFDKYCMGSGQEDGMMNAGYKIWREAVADIMMDSILSDGALFHLDEIREQVLALNADISIQDPEAKGSFAKMVYYIMCAKEVSCTDKWKEVEQAIKEELMFDEPIMFSILKMVFENLHQPPFWSITPEFILNLGSAYLSLLSFRLYDNLPQ